MTINAAPHVIGRHSSKTTLNANWAAVAAALGSQVYAADPAFGVVGDDGTVDNTAALNLCIAYANANANTTFILPAGIIRYVPANLTTITATGCYFRASGGPNSSRLVADGGSGSFVFSSASQFCGFIGVGFNDIAATPDNITIQLNGADHFSLESCHVDTGVGTLLKLGVGALSTYVTVHNLAGVCANVAVPFIDIRGGTNFVYRGCDVRPSGLLPNGTPSTAVSGRYFMQIAIDAASYSGCLLDATHVVDSDCSEFNQFINATGAGATALGPIFVENVLIDSCVAGGITMALTTSCRLNRMQVTGKTWLKVDDGNAIEVSGDGTTDLLGLLIDANIVAAGDNAISLSGLDGCEQVNIDGAIYNVENVSTGSGIRLEGGAKWRNIKITADVCLDSPERVTTANRPDYGVLVQGAIERFEMIGARVRGKAYGFAHLNATGMVSPTIVGCEAYSDDNPSTPVIQTASFSGAPIVRSNRGFDAVASRDYVPDGSVSLPALAFYNDPDCGLYRIGANNLGIAVGGAKILDILATGLDVVGALRPASDDGGALGSTTRRWSDLFLAEGGVINWDNGDVTITQTGNVLAFAGAPSGYTFDGGVVPAASDGAALGSASLMWADLFLASGAVVNFNNGNVTITHSAGGLAENGYHRFGSASAPANTTAGDVTAVRLALGNFALNTGEVLSINANALAAPAGPSTDCLLHVVQADGVANRPIFDAFGSVPALTYRRANNTAASPSSLSTNDQIGSFSAFGYHGGGAYSTGARAAILFAAAENWSSINNQGTYIEFYTTALGASAQTRRVHIANDGGVVLANSTTSPGANSLRTGGEVQVDGDVGGASSCNTLTGTSNLTANSTGVGTILFKGTTNRNSAGFIKIYIDTTAYYVPVFSAITG